MILSDILIKNVWLFDKVTDIYIKGNLIKQVGEHLAVDASRVIDGSGKAVIPGLVNTHTHAAMTLFRGFGDDMKLMPWLEEKIWPNEAKMTDEDVYWGAKLACLEMIKTGTTTFFDMYQRLEATAQAVEEMGVRGVLSGVCFDHFNPELMRKGKQKLREQYSRVGSFTDRITYSLGPHAIYTVSGEMLQWVNRFSVENGLLIHLHLAETEEEVANSLRDFGLTPVRYLHRLGVLSPRLMIAHGVYVDEEEIQLLADHGVKVAHNPASNMKLGSGIHFRFKEMKEKGIAVGIGTDGCSSSNNLDMIEAMKLASLLGKGWRKDPEALTAEEMLEAATVVGASIAGLNAGRIAEGYLADLSLIDLKMPAFAPNFHFVSNLVYAANGSCVDTVICNGRILMENKKVAGEEAILEKASEVAYRLMER
ncbi:5-methylthioadenosine/S-adenosylhomocysteine deaminase [Parabacteroides sp. PFB2-12]|uniref:amidohydrolase n=1 Tax=unclassified Parabacteroides TaxID=2649774 RepID=UPI00247448D5|nr:MULTISPECIES: amidohydrolase [unclassified Parabacteroides]MDH6342522.1 5-methylthioadenosine/S-adenosylhomocysteine deaminase [Parabacteroides sp. PM6-13]MDH6390174.1 5-methylthioadenosine/S-adenosylhomocysteine deaminase [Parabacteroides sp. PFB2-12]